jgi:uncharacterized secreted protein with C-terminal beta-propeller domain
MKISKDLEVEIDVDFYDILDYIKYDSSYSERRELCDLLKEEMDDYLEDIVEEKIEEEIEYLQQDGRLFEINSLEEEMKIDLLKQLFQRPIEDLQQLTGWQPGVGMTK